MFKRLPEPGDEIGVITMRIDTQETRERHNSRQIANEPRVAIAQISEQERRGLPSFHLVPGPPRRYQRPFIEPGVASLPQIAARRFCKTVEFSAVRGEEQSGSARGFESPQRVLCDLLR